MRRNHYIVVLKSQPQGTISYDLEIKLNSTFEFNDQFCNTSVSIYKKLLSISLSGFRSHAMDWRNSLKINLNCTNSSVLNPC